MQKIRVIRIIKNIAFYITNLALTATSLGYFWNAEYKLIEISRRDRQLMCSDANFYNLVNCFENKTANNNTLYFVYKIVNTTNHEYILSEDYKTCAAISYDTFFWFDLATNKEYAYRTISSIEYFVYMFFGIFIVFKSIKGFEDLEITGCFAQFRAKFKYRFYKLLCLPGYFLVDSIDYTKRCVIRANGIVVQLSIYIVFSNLLIFFAIFAALGKECKCDKCSETNPCYKFFMLCAFVTFFYLILCIPIYIVHFYGSWIAIFVSVNLTIDLVSDVVLDFFMAGEEARVVPENIEVNNAT